MLSAATSLRADVSSRKAEVVAKMSLKIQLVIKGLQYFQVNINHRCHHYVQHSKQNTHTWRTGCDSDERQYVWKFTQYNVLISGNQMKTKQLLHYSKSINLEDMQISKQDTYYVRQSACW